MYKIDIFLFSHEFLIPKGITKLKIKAVGSPVGKTQAVSKQKNTFKTAKTRYTRPSFQFFLASSLKKMPVGLQFSGNRKLGLLPLEYRYFGLNVIFSGPKNLAATFPVTRYFDNHVECKNKEHGWFS